MKLRNIFGKDREKEIDLFCGLIKKHFCIIDIGANRGTYSYPISKRISRNGKLYLFEPLPELFYYLKNGFINKKNIFVYEKACGNIAQSKPIRIPLYNGTKGLGSASFVNNFKDFLEMDLEVLKIDDLKLSRIDLLKIDVEGYETFVLEGALHSIRKSKPVILVEIDWNMGNEYFDRLTNLIRDLDYRILSLTGNIFLEVGSSEFNSNKLNFHEAGYRNNFFLIPSGRFEEVKKLLENQNYLFNFFRRFI